MIIVCCFEQNACATPFLSGAGQASYRPLADSVSDCFSRSSRAVHGDLYKEHGQAITYRLI
jgi:hypothetical protein